MENLDFGRIHRFRFEDLNIVLDVNSGSVHIVDQATWDFFDYLVVNPFETTSHTFALKKRTAHLTDAVCLC